MSVRGEDRPCFRFTRYREIWEHTERKFMRCWRWNEDGTGMPKVINRSSIDFTCIVTQASLGSRNIGFGCVMDRYIIARKMVIRDEDQGGVSSGTYWSALGIPYSVCPGDG